MWDEFDQEEINYRLGLLDQLSADSPSDVLATYVRATWTWHSGDRETAKRQLTAIAHLDEVIDGIPDFTLALSDDDPLMSHLGLDADPEELRELAKDEEEWRTHYTVAGNPLTPASALRVLVENAAADEEEAVGTNFGAPQEILAELSSDEDDFSRQSVAENPATSGRILRKLATDEAGDVRLAVAANYSTPQDVLTDLLHDGDDQVRETARRNPFTRT